MGLAMLQNLGLVVKVCVFACVFVLQGSGVSGVSPSSSVVPALSPSGEQTPRHVSHGEAFRIGPPSSASQPNGTILHPPLALLPLRPAPGPQSTKGATPPSLPNSPTFMPPYSSNPPPVIPYGVVPALPPSDLYKRPRPSENPVPGKEAPEPVAPSPSKLQRTLSPVRPTLPKELPSSSPEHNAPPISTPPLAINHRRADKRVTAPMNGSSIYHPHVNLSPRKAPSTNNVTGDLNSLPPPLLYSQSSPDTRLRAPASLPSSTTQKHHHSSSNVVAPPPLFNEVCPHASTKEEGHDSPAPSPSPPGQTKMPLPSPKVTTPRSLPRNLKKPFRALPPPPPNADCASLTCSEPLTNGLAGPLCICVLPIQVGLRLSVALYTFFPLVSELAAEISTGVFMKQSQVRIMGANEASQNPEKTVVLINLVPLGEKFDNTTAYLTFQRFWHKQVNIKTSVFGNYEVLYVRYPGFPPSPPPAFSNIGIIDGEPYHNHDSNARMKPIGVDVSRIGHKNGPNRSVIVAIVLSVSVAVILCCAVAWVLLLKYRGCFSQPERTPPKAIPSIAKSSGAAASVIGSRPSSASLSYGSSFAAYTGSAKTFSSSEIEKATDNFTETRILGEGGFGRVYCGVLDDGSKVAVKILKRDDHQGGREFLAEVEMLSRLHHRNLVKLIGICTEDRTRCLVYELVPNGSVESHLHGVDKETASLDWGSRLKIALGAARGLAYLHEDSSPRVIHRDFKSSNILLEHDFTPKVSDFGLARTALDEENRHISTRVMGTFGYVAPEYAMTGHLLVKSDVYSYGVVLLELLTGRKPVDMSQPPGQENLVTWARPLLTSEESLASIVDPSLGPNFPFDSIRKVAAIASMCVEPEVSNRPFMGEVVQALKLVCNECDETKELGFSSHSLQDLPVNTDARISTNSERQPDPLCTASPVSHYDHRFDLERGLSMSELLSSSVQFERPEYESLGRHSCSEPLRTKNTRLLWQKIRRLSGGSVSEHGVVFSLWPGSN